MIQLTRTLSITLFLAAVTLLATNSSSHAQDKPAGAKNLIDTIKSNPDTKLFAMIVDKLGLSNMLSAPIGFTLFVPNDATLEKWGGKAKIDAANGPATSELLGIVQGCIVTKKYMAADLKPGDLPTMNSKTITIAVDGDKITAGGSPIAKPDVVCSNGVIHIVDGLPFKK